MSVVQIRDYARGKGFHSQTVERWLSWDPADSEALFLLVANLRMGENHQRDLMDWLEEIALRDQSRIQELLTSKALKNIESDPRLGRADKLKRIKEHVRRLRFPRLAQTEDAIRGRIQALKLHPEIRVTVPPGLEGGNVHVEFCASNHAELKRHISKLAAVADQASMTEIFELMAGRDVEKN